jgi:hypothetical protein
VNGKRKKLFNKPFAKPKTSGIVFNVISNNNETRRMKMSDEAVSEKVSARQESADRETYKPSGNGGIKSMRRATAKKPSHSCGNCGCTRYSPCTCIKK